MDTPSPAPLESPWTAAALAKSNLSDVTIIGAGPIGLAVAAALQQEGVQPLVVDRGVIGQTISWYAPGTRFFSSAQNLELLGFPLVSYGEKPTREEYLAYLRAFVRFHRLAVRTYHTVVGLTGSLGQFRLTIRGLAGNSWQQQTRLVVLALGSMERPHLLGIPGENLAHVSHYFREPHFYFGSRVAIVGGSNSACEAAVTLCRLGIPVTLIHRRPAIDGTHIKYWIYPELQGMIRRREIQTYFGYEVTKIEATALQLQRLPESEASQTVPLRDDAEVPDSLEPEIKTTSPPSANTEPNYCEADLILLLTGYEPDYALLTQAGIEFVGAQRRPLVQETTLETNRPGIFAVGTLLGGDQHPYQVYIENGRYDVAKVVPPILHYLKNWRCPTEAPTAENVRRRIQERQPNPEFPANDE